MAIQTTTFKGARYIVKFHNPIQWSDTESYEAIEAVQYNAYTYISKQPVPVGVQIDNEAFWLLWADPNAQMEQLRQLVSGYVDQVEELSDDVDAFAAMIPASDFSAVNTVKKYIDLDISKAHVFATVADMKAADTLSVGAICHTNGFHTPGDGGAWYEITDSGTANEMDVIACGELFANLMIAETYVAPEMFGAYGDGTHNDTDNIKQMLTYDVKKYLFAKRYFVTDTITVSNKKNCVFDFGNIVPESKDTLSILFKFRNCNNVDVNGLVIEGTNDKTAYNISGFTPVAGAVSSNLVGIQIEKCNNCRFNDHVSEHMLFGIRLVIDNDLDSYSDDNENIMFENIQLLNCHEGIHSTEANNVVFENLIVTSETVTNNGYHTLYFERNTKKIEINGFDFSYNTGSSTRMLDFADFSDTGFDTNYKQEIMLSNGKVKGNYLIITRYNNKILSFDNVEFDITLPQNTASCWIIEGVSDSTYYPTIEFKNCNFMTENGIAASVITLDPGSNQYPKDFEFSNCKMINSIGAGFLGNCIIKNCFVDNSLIRIFKNTQSEADGKIRVYNSEITSYEKGYSMSQRSSYLDVMLFNCLINSAAQYILNNGSDTSNITFIDCFIDDANATSFATGTTTGVNIVQSYLNGTLISL